MVKQQYTKEFKEDAVRYLKEHKELGIQGCAKNLVGNAGFLSVGYWIS